MQLFEVGARLSLSTRTVARLVADGELPVVRIGRLVRVTPADLDAFIASRTAGRITEPPANEVEADPVVLTPVKRTGGQRALYIFLRATKSERASRTSMSSLRRALS